MQTPDYDFLKTAGRVLNAGQARALILTGNVNDLFCLSYPQGEKYVPLVEFVTAKWNVPSRILIVYELNGPIRFLDDNARNSMREAWLKWRTGLSAEEYAVRNMLAAGKARAELEVMSNAFDTNLQNAVGRPTVALELLRQMCLCSRMDDEDGPLLREDLIIVVEAADLVIPQGEISRLPDADRHRIAICRDWFSDPGFNAGNDSVLLLSESRSLLNQRVAQLPQLVEVQVPAPDATTRAHCIDWFDESQPSERKLKLENSRDELARFTAGLSIHALLQMLKGASHEGRTITLKDVIEKVEDFIRVELGEDVVEFKKPEHTLSDVVGFSRLKGFLREELMPRFRSSGPDALPGAAVCGPIGSGKTFIFEAVAAELDMVVLVLKNIRSQWYGQTDVIFERLRRVLDALAKVLIFVDEADTQFGGVGPQAHATERRLTGKVQAMMSDPRLRGRVIWLLMTARIHLLSPDIRRPGRVGDLIIPILDPTDGDRKAFLDWMAKPALGNDIDDDTLDRIDAAMSGHSAAVFASIRSELKAKVVTAERALTVDEVVSIIRDRIPPAIGQTRRYQALQALVNCTRRSLLPDPEATERERTRWAAEIRELEVTGIR